MKLFFKCISCVLIVAIAFLCLTSLKGRYVGEKEYIVNSLYSLCEKIDLSGMGIKKSELGMLITEMLKENPYLFFVKSSMGYEADAHGNVLCLYPYYNMDARVIEQSNALCDREISRALTLIDEEWSDYARALAMHDYLCINFSYDNTLCSDNMYSFLSSGKGTCQGYTYTYTALLRKLGIEVSYAASDTMSHIWNVVRLDAEWYHVDVTWDDKDKFSFVYNSFLKSDEDIGKTNHRDWYTPEGVECTSNIYNEEITSPLKCFSGTGDVNCDGEVDLLDLVLYRAQKNPPSNHAFLLSAADIDGDFLVGETDEALLLDKILD